MRLLNIDWVRIVSLTRSHRINTRVLVRMSFHRSLRVELRLCILSLRFVSLRSRLIWSGNLLFMGSRWWYLPRWWVFWILSSTVGIRIDIRWLLFVTLRSIVLRMIDFRIIVLILYINSFRSCQLIMNIAQSIINFWKHSIDIIFLEIRYYCRLIG